MADTAHQKGAAIVIGGGIAGLATAALLGAEGWDVTVLEARDEVGGRAGSWERERLPLRHRPQLVPHARGVRPLLPPARHDRRAGARPGPPRPGVPGLHGADGHAPAPPTDVRSGRDAATALFESIEPGAGAKLDAYLDSAADAYELSVTRFLYDTYETTAGLRDPVILRRAGSSLRCSRSRSPLT